MQTRNATRSFWDGSATQHDPRPHPSSKPPHWLSWRLSNHCPFSPEIRLFVLTSSPSAHSHALATRYNLWVLGVFPPPIVRGSLPLRSMLHQPNQQTNDPIIPDIGFHNTPTCYAIPLLSNLSNATSPPATAGLPPRCCFCTRPVSLGISPIPSSAVSEPRRPSA